MGYKCPYCGEVTPEHLQQTNEVDVYFDQNTREAPIYICMKKCGGCNKISFLLMGIKVKWGGTVFYSYPPAGIKPFPDYVPEAVRNDYIEALSILQLSPKASATLARRCLQGIIHDFWGIHEKNLNAEITSLKEKVTVSQWKAIDALRKVGNIGAHMEHDVDHIIDVDPDEAEKLLKLIELLIDKWYVARHDEEALLREIAEIGDNKEAERKS